MRVVTFIFALGALQANAQGTKAVHRPQALCFNSRLDPAHKVLAFAWDHGKTTAKPVTYTYQRPQ